jgi:hypothetical protein
MTMEELGMKMDYDWFLKKPIDFEHKKYVLLDFLKKVDEDFSFGKIYPSFTEVAFQMASVQNFLRNRKYFSLKKEFEEKDDEILLFEIKEKKPKQKFDAQDYPELEKICEYSSLKFMEYFTIAKTIWSFAFETTEVKPKKNIENHGYGMGFAFYHDKFTHKHYVWLFELKKINKKHREHKCVFKLLYEGDKKITMKSLKSSMEGNAKELAYKFPVFELTSEHNLDLEQTLIPIFKRKIMNHIFQTVTQKELSENAGTEI